MNNIKYTDNELNLMSYQELRRLSILLRLPANIKKTYMISMIQAHQKGDGFTKTAIANKVMEERKIKRLTTKGRQAKPYIMVSTTTTQQIMLPRNHSLTTPVRLMPQYERGFAPLTQYEAVPGLSNAKANFDDSGSYNYHFHGEYSNTMMTSSSHEMYRNETYWHPREIYNNSLMPILSSLLTPNSMPINSTGFTSQYASQNATKSQSSFQQGIYEKYVKSGGLIEGQTYQSNATNSTLMLNNSYTDENTSNNNSDTQGNYVVTKNDIDFEVNSTVDDSGYQQFSRRDDTVIRHANSSLSHLGENYSQRAMEYNGYSNGGTKDLSSCIGEFFGSENDLSQSEDDFRKTGALIHPSTKLVNNGVNHYRLTAVPLSQSEAERTCATEERIWEETDGGERDELWKTSTERNFVSVPDGDNRGPSSSDVSENFNYCTSDAVQTTESTWDKRRLNENHVSIRHSDFPRCRYILGHNKYPEVVNKKSDVTAVLPSFWSTFSAYGTNNKVYSLCRNSFTGTTETHVSPIMISTYAKQYTHGNSQLTSNNPEESPQISRPWVYTYSEPSQSSFSVENSSYSTWNEYSSEVGDKMLSSDNPHEVQVVKCRKHGCHYLYSVPSSCNQGELQKDRAFDQTAQIKPFI
ncbi:hypothetical protein RUM43_007298 [Polyplax serrata]|uniref:Uncharacterized protein n=1 Tax=Polyplax serrata TaxID=468196 RepID=A0AAN8Q5W0_POLSC